MLATVLLTILCIVALLFIPIELVFSVRRDTSFHGDLSLVWMFGLVRLPVPVQGGEESVQANRKSGKSRKSKTKIAGPRSLMAVLSDSRIRHRVYRFGKDIFAALHMSELYLRLRLGLDDPAETGVLWAFVGVISAFLSNLKFATINIEPEFGGLLLDLDSHGQMKIIPIELIVLVITFLLSPTMIRGFWIMRR